MDEMDDFDDLIDGLKAWLEGLSMLVTASRRCFNMFNASKFGWLGDG